MILKCPFCFRKLKPSLVGTYFECHNLHDGFDTSFKSYTHGDLHLTVKLKNHKVFEFIHSKDGIRTIDGTLYNIVDRKDVKYDPKGVIDFQFSSKEKQDLITFLGSASIKEVVERFEKIMILS